MHFDKTVKIDLEINNNVQFRVSLFLVANENAMIYWCIGDEKHQIAMSYYNFVVVAQ